MLKRFLCILVLNTLFLQSFFPALALIANNLEINNVNLQNNSINQNLEGLFLNNLGNNTFKVNFQDITAENAGKTIKTWSGKINFPNKFVLENGFNLEINTLELDKLFQRTTDLKTKINQAKSSRIDIGTVNIKEPTLKLLPDRVQITTETEVVFKTNAQLNNIKSKLGIGLTNSGYQNFTNNLKNLSKNEKSNVTKAREKLNNDLLNGVDSSINKLNIDVDAEMLKGLIKDCKKEKGQNSADCTESKIKNDLQTLDKSVVTTEMQEFSLLPPNTVIGNTQLTSINPEDVRLSRQEILGVFQKYGHFALGNTNTGTTNEPSRPSISNESNPFEQADYCEIVSNGDTNKKAECERLLQEKNEAKEKVYNKNLLNGFTLGESDRYHWDDSVRLHYFIGKKKLASASIDFRYNYGFGIRIPIKAEIKIDKQIVDDWENNSKYDIYAKVDTLQAPKSFYEGVGLPEEKIFNGKEFVFELGASLDFSVRVIGDLIDIDEHIPLISILAKIIKERGETLFGITGSELDDVIKNNGFNKSRDFTPPFAGKAKEMLFEGQVDVPVYEIPSLLKLVVSLINEVSLDGAISSKLTQVNTTQCKTSSNASCPNTITFDTLSYKKYSAKAVFNGESYQENALGQYSNFGVKLSDFKYIPQIVFEIFVKGTASVKLPYFGWESYSTPKIKVYQFKLDLPSLGTHEGTDGTFEALENKVYATNPVIEMQKPIVEILGNNDRATFTITNHNTSSMVKTYYTVDGTNPNCTNKGELYLGVKTKIWKNPFNDIVNTKNFTIKAIACSIFSDFTDIGSKTITLKNESFKFSFSPKISQNLSQITTNQRIEILDSDYLANLNIRYSLDGSTPSCNNGILYNSATGFTLYEVGRDTLENDFNTNIKAIACNKNGGTLNQIMTQNYLVHNVYYNPRISFSPTPGISFNRHPDSEQYTTSVKFSVSGVAPTCTLGLSLNDVAPVIPLGSTVKAITCIYKKRTGISDISAQNTPVFVSDVVSKTSDLGVEANKFKELAEQIQHRLKGQLDDRIFRAFGDFGLDEFENILNTGIDEGQFSVEGLRGIGGLLESGDVSQKGMVEIGKLYSGFRNGKLNKTTFQSGLNQLLVSDELSSNGMKTLSSMVKNGALTSLEIENIAGAIGSHFEGNNMPLPQGRQNNFRVMQTTSYSQDLNNEENGNDNHQIGTMSTTYNSNNNGIERKYANTKMPGCDENDIVYGDKVWASCNSNYDLTNSLYYPGITETSKDINGWSYGRLYEHKNSSCPSGYRIPDIQDFNFTDNNIFDDVLKLPAGGVYSQYLGLGDNVLFGHKDQRGYYITSENYFGKFYYFNRSANQNNDLNFFGVKLSDNTKIPKGSLRCIRVNPATDIEKGMNTGNNSNSGSITNSGNIIVGNNTYFSDDEYVNAKLTEINDNFILYYQENIVNIDETIKKLEEEKQKASSGSQGNYDIAIKKLQEIKDLLVKRYTFLQEYNVKKKILDTKKENKISQ